MNESQEPDPLLKRAYQTLGREEPAAWLEQKLRRAAREEVGAHPSGFSRLLAMRFGFPLAFAAVLVLSVSLVMVMRDVPEVREIAVARDTAEAPASQPSPPVLKAEEQRRRDQPAGLGIPPLAETDQARNDPQQAVLARTESARVGAGEDRNVIAAPAELPRAPQAPMGDVMKREHVEAGRPSTLPGSPPVAAAERPAAQVAAPAASAPTPADPASAAPEGFGRLRQSTRATEAVTRPSAESPKQVDLDYANPERWLNHIVELRRQGREREARENLEAFRKRYPDHPIPEILR